MPQVAECGDNRGERELEQHRAQRAAKDDQGSGRLQDLAQVATLQQQPGHDAGNGQQDPGNARLIHGSPSSYKLIQQPDAKTLAPTPSIRTPPRGLGTPPSCIQRPGSQSLS